MKPVDPISAVRAVTREVKQIERDGRPAHVIVAARNYSTGIDDAWDALTNAERIPRWFLPIEGELKLGGRYQFKGNAGGTILACEPPRHLAVTWEMNGEPSWVHVRLESLDAQRTRLTLEHTAHVPKEFWGQYGPGAVGVGWDLGMLALELYLASGSTQDPKETEAWAASDQGKQFARSSSEAWGDASIAMGTDPAQARAAIVQTTAFYTGG